MNTKQTEALKLALEALELHGQQYPHMVKGYCLDAITAIREALAEQPAQSKECQCPACKIAPHASDCPVHNEPAWPNGPCDCGAQPEQEPEFFTHSVDQPYDWSDWVCPDPKSYLMKCCDCGLVHEAQFGVVRYKSETEREDCDMVDDPNLQAVFRMRRSEQWSPEDTAHRAGGLPMEQPAQQQEPVKFSQFLSDVVTAAGLLAHGKTDKSLAARISEFAFRLRTSPTAQRKPLTDEEIETYRYMIDWTAHWSYIDFARAIEAAHGIGEKPDAA